MAAAGWWIAKSGGPAANRRNGQPARGCPRVASHPVLISCIEVPPTTARTRCSIRPSSPMWPVSHIPARALGPALEGPVRPPAPCHSVTPDKVAAASREAKTQPAAGCSQRCHYRSMVGPACLAYAHVLRIGRVAGRCSISRSDGRLPSSYPSAGGFSIEIEMACFLECVLEGIVRDLDHHHHHQTSSPSPQQSRNRPRLTSRGEGGGSKGDLETLRRH